MPNSYIIEVHQARGNSVGAGIVVKERSGFRVFSAAPAFATLDGCLFRSPSEAEKVATRISTSAKSACGCGQASAAAQAHTHNLP
jgi:hypothetical protein